MSRPKNSRLVAAEIIMEWRVDGRFPDRRLARLQHDHAFIMEVVNGVVRRFALLEWLEKQWLKKPPSPFVRSVLYVGLYQLLFMDVEHYAAIHETVNAAKQRRGGAAAAGMINAVLRRAQREEAEVLNKMEQLAPHVRLSHPKLLMERWEKNYGQAAAVALAEWNNRPPQTLLRVEQSQISVDDFLAQLAEKGIEPEPHPFSDREAFFILPRGVAVKTLPGYDRGWFTIQDPATSVSVNLLDPKPGETVLDACAAPGGKTAMMAGRMQGQGRLVAMDLHEDRIEVLQENCRRMQLGWVEVVQGDACRPTSLEGTLFDALLLDVPCLNTGVLRRRADARWRIDEPRIQKITKLQSTILSASAALLKPAGRLVYSTCSLESEENEELVARWLEAHPEFQCIEQKKAFPPETNTDGAFAALIMRK